jgi:hypothetical protein
MLAAVNRLLLVASLAACGTAGSASPKLDSGTAEHDARIGVDSPPPPDQLGTYRHTIQIDGGDDFAPAEQFATTSAAYTARVTWDDQAVYVGYSGPDLDPAAADTGTKWMFVYLDVDPGAATGGTTSLRYNTQQATFPSGFGAELYARWRCDATLSSLEQRAADGTYAAIGTPIAGQAGTFAELAIPRSLLGGGTSIGLVTWMINEKPGLEGSFAGLFGDNFADGYSAALPLTRYLRIDFSSPASPNDPANVAP